MILSTVYSPQAPQSTGFSRQEFWSGLPFPSPGDLQDPGMELTPPALRAGSLPSEPGENQKNIHNPSLNEF